MFKKIIDLLFSEGGFSLFIVLPMIVLYYLLAAVAIV